MNQPVRILYVDDNPLDRELVRDALEKETDGFEVVEAASRAEFESLLGKGGFDLVLSDFNILGFEGLQVLGSVRAIDSRLPVIIVTGTGSEEIAAEAIKRGAADYVIKSPKHIRHLPHTIHTVLEKMKLEDERRQAEEAVRESEQHYRSLFEESPISLWEEDFSKVRRYIEDLRGEGVTDFREYFESHPDDISKCIEKIKVIDVNQSTIMFLEAESKADIIGHMSAIFPEDNRESLQQEFINIAEGKTDFEWQGINLTLSGKRRQINLRWTVAFGHEDTFDRVLLSMVDITERKKAEEETQRRLMDLQVLYETSQRLGSQLTPDEIGRVILEILKEHLEWHHAVVRLRKEESDKFEIIGYSAPGVIPENYAAEIGRINSLVGHVGQGMNGWVMQHGEAARSGDLPSDPRYIETYPGIRSGIYAPMIAGERVNGVLAVESEIADAFDKNDERLLVTVAKITANAIHRSHLREQTELQLHRLGALRSIDQVISASFDIHITLGIFLNHTVTQLGADAALLLVLDPAMNSLVFAAEYGLNSSAVKKIHMRMGEGDIGRVIMERRAMSISNPHEVGKPFMHPELGTGQEFASCHAVPLISKGLVKGVLEIYLRTSVTPDQEWQNFLETLAGQAAIALDNSQLFENLQSSNFELAIAYDETIEGWSTAMDLRDQETEGHTQRVTKLTQQLGAALSLTENELVHVRRGSLLHDIGKMGVPDSILLKPGKLTRAEWEVMHRHPQLAHDMLAPITFLRPAMDIPFCHHEKWDGTGYPRGLKGNEIPVSARIFAVVDVYDALTSDRPYRKAWPRKKALDYIGDQSGKHFDPEVVGIFLKMISEVS